MSDPTKDKLGGRRVQTPYQDILTHLRGGEDAKSAQDIALAIDQYGTALQPLESAQMALMLDAVQDQATESLREIDELVIDILAKALIDSVSDQIQARGFLILADCIFQRPGNTRSTQGSKQIKKKARLGSWILPALWKALTRGAKRITRAAGVLFLELLKDCPSTASKFRESNPAEMSLLRSCFMETEDEILRMIVGAVLAELIPDLPQLQMLGCDGQTLAILQELGIGKTDYSEFFRLCNTKMKQGVFNILGNRMTLYVFISGVAFAEHTHISEETTLIVVDYSKSITIFAQPVYGDMHLLLDVDPTLVKRATLLGVNDSRRLHIDSFDVWIEMESQDLQDANADPCLVNGRETCPSPITLSFARQEHPQEFMIWLNSNTSNDASRVSSAKTHDDHRDGVEPKSRKFSSLASSVRPLLPSSQPKDPLEQQIATVSISCVNTSMQKGHSSEQTADSEHRPPQMERTRTPAPPEAGSKVGQTAIAKNVKTMMRPPSLQKATRITTLNDGFVSTPKTKARTDQPPTTNPRSRTKITLYGKGRKNNVGSCDLTNSNLTPFKTRLRMQTGCAAPEQQSTPRKRKGAALDLDQRTDAAHAQKDWSATQTSREKGASDAPGDVQIGPSQGDRSKESVNNEPIRPAPGGPEARSKPDASISPAAARNNQDDGISIYRDPSPRDQVVKDGGNPSQRSRPPLQELATNALITFQKKRSKLQAADIETVGLADDNYCYNDRPEPNASITGKIAGSLRQDRVGGLRLDQPLASGVGNKSSRINGKSTDSFAKKLDSFPTPRGIGEALNFPNKTSSVKEQNSGNANRQVRYDRTEAGGSQLPAARLPEPAPEITSSKRKLQVSESIETAVKRRRTDTSAGRTSDEGQAQAGTRLSGKKQVICFDRTGPRNQGLATQASRSVSHTEELKTRVEALVPEALPRPKPTRAPQTPAPSTPEPLNDDLENLPPSKQSEDLQDHSAPSASPEDELPDLFGCSQGSRVAPNGSPMPRASARVAGAVNSQSQHRSQMVAAGGTHAKNPKHTLSSPSESSQASALPLHEVHETGIMFNPETDEMVLPMELADPFSNSGHKPGSAFARMLHDATHKSKKRPLEEAPPVVSPKRRRTLDVQVPADDPEITLVEDPTMYLVSDKPAAAKALGALDSQITLSVCPPADDTSQETQSREPVVAALEAHQSSMQRVLSASIHALFTDILKDESSLKNCTDDFKEGGKMLAHKFREDSKAAVGSKSKAVAGVRDKLRSAYDEAASNLKHDAESVREVSTQAKEKLDKTLDRLKVSTKAYLGICRGTTVSPGGEPAD